MSSPSPATDETRSQDSVHCQFAICSWHSTCRHRIFHAPLWKIAGRLLNSNESSAQCRVFAGDGGGPSTLHITGAATVTVSPRPISCTATCMTCRTKCRDSDLRHGLRRGRNTPRTRRWWRPPRPKPDPCVVKWRAALPHWRRRLMRMRVHC